MERLLQTPITLALLLSNVGVSLYAFTDPALIRELSFQPRRIQKDRQFYRFLTAGFVHASGTHLAFNMITLYFFGPLIERILGAGVFLILYFGSELAAHTLTFFFNRDDPHYSAVGASGAVSGVVFAFCVFFPLRNLYLFFALPIPAVLFAFGYVLGSIYAMRRGGREEGIGDWIAHEAHVGGAIAGVLITVAAILLDPATQQIFLRAMEQTFG
ncbi:MAG: rhomboid family intramembrane serine protease [Salinibacter sp.]